MYPRSAVLRGYWFKCPLFIESRVGEVDVFLVHLLLSQADGFAEVINLSNRRSALEPQGI